MRKILLAIAIAFAFLCPAALAKGHHHGWQHQRHAFLVAHNSEIVKAVDATLAYNSLDQKKARHLPCGKNAFQLKLYGVDDAVSMACGSTITDYVRDHIAEYRLYQAGKPSYGALTKKANALTNQLATEKKDAEANDKAWLRSWNDLAGTYHKTLKALHRSEVESTIYFWLAIAFLLAFVIASYRNHIRRGLTNGRARAARAYRSWQEWRDRRAAEDLEDERPATDAVPPRQG